MIYTFIPYAPTEHDKDLAWAYNDCMKMLGDDDWACFVDHDAIFTTPNWYHQLNAIIEKHPEYSCFTAMTNRVGAEWQIPTGIDKNNHNMTYHRHVGAKLQGENYGRVEDVTSPPTIPLSGVMILYKKSLWNDIPFEKYAADRLTGVDNLLHISLQKKGHKVGLMTGVYLYHWYRAEIKLTEEHELASQLTQHQPPPCLVKKPDKPDMSVQAALNKIQHCKEDDFIIVGAPLPYSHQIDVRTCLWIEYQKRKPNMMALYEPSRFARFGRNKIIHNVLTYLPGVTHVFFVDNDVVPPVDAIERLLAHDKDIIAGVTPIFKQEPMWSVMKYDPDEKIDNNFTPIPYLELPDGLFRAHHFGATSVLIKRHVLEKMQYPWYQDIFAPGVILLGQDLYFTAKAKHLGFELWCDPTVKSEHIRQADLKYAFDKCLGVAEKELADVT